jgi:ankyrin repeat protein
MATCPTLFDVIYTGTERDVEAALSRKDVNVLEFNDKGQTVIHITSEDNAVPFDIFKLVVNKRIAAINFRNHSAGNTPLHCACLARDLEKVQYLVKKGARLEARNRSDETPLLVACKQQASEIVTYLLEKGANRNAEDNEQKTIATISHNFPNNASLKIAIKTDKIIASPILARKFRGDFAKLKQENDELRSQKQEMETKYHEALLQNVTLVKLLNNIKTEIKTKYSDQTSLQNSTLANQLNNLKKDMETKCLEMSLQSAAWTEQQNNLMKDIERSCLEALLQNAPLTAAEQL